MFYKILTVINALALLVVLGFSGYGVSMYGPTIMNNMDHILQLDKIAQQVEANTTDVADIKLTLNPFDGVDTLQYDGEFLRGFVDVVGYLDVNAVEGEASGAIFRFNTDNVNDDTLLTTLEDVGGPFGALNEEGGYELALGCSTADSLTGDGGFTVSGDQFTKLADSSLEKPVNVRFFFGEQDSTAELCTTKVLALQVLTEDETDTEDDDAEETAGAAPEAPAETTATE